MALGDYTDLVAERLRDTADIITLAERAAAVTEAVRRYSLVVPRETVASLVGDGVAYRFALPTGYEDGLSSLLAIEHPTGSQVPTLLSGEDYDVRLDPVSGVKMIWFGSLVLGAAETAYVYYTARHTVNDMGQDTVMVAHREPVACLAAAICLRQLAAYYAQASDATLAVDSINHRDKTAQYLTLAREYERQFREGVGVGNATLVGPAGGPYDLDVPLQGPFGDPFYHPTRAR